MDSEILYTALRLDTPQQMPFQVAHDVIAYGEIANEHGLMSWGSNYTFLITVSHDAGELLAIYKPRKGERPLWDFPDGTLCNRESASFLVSEALGWRIVPPTVLREGPHGLGSVQVFIDHDPEQHYFTFDTSLEEQLMRMAVFDAIINNADRKGGHCLLDSANHLWGIDHGLAFNVDHKLRTVIWDFAGQALPEAVLQAVADFHVCLCDAEGPLVTRLRSLLSEAETAALEKRTMNILNAKAFPLPGTGPNRPWPPV